MKKIHSYLTLFLAITILMSVIAYASPANADEIYKIEGYVTDQNGAPVEGAGIIFNNLNVPYATTNSQGYYSVYAPAGTYHLCVWPPYDSNYVMYEHKDFKVSGPETKDITLNSGYKVYGYVQNAAGAPMIGASVLFKTDSTVLSSGYFTNQAGYYYIVVPPGIYTIDAHPQTAYDPNYKGQCTPFPNYIETGYTVAANTYRNITVGETAPAGKVLTAGYIIDENGKGISGANIIFNVPQIVPSVYSDSTGYYQIASPEGTYHVSVWPPKETSYINYDQQSYTVNSNTIKNITLPTGLKVSGYIKNQDGNPIQGAVVQVGNYLSGYFSTQTGYYFVAVPQGTYTINAHPGVNPSKIPMADFQTYIEYNFQVFADTTKNITVTTPTINPTPTPTAQPTTQPTTNPTTKPTPTPTPNLPQSHLTIQTNAQNYQVGSTMTLTGILTNQKNTPIADKTVSISYAAENTAQWTSIGATQTDAQGQFSLQWLIPASGTFTLKAQWAGDHTTQSTESTATVSFGASAGNQVFFVQSNSTITNLSFNTRSHTITFAASGPDGSTGQTQVAISKTLIEDASFFAVSLDGNQLQFSITDQGENWVVKFSYHHSSHIITVDLEAAIKAQAINQFDSATTAITIGLALAIVVCIVAAGLIHYKRRSKG